MSILIGDCREIMPTLDAASFDAIITDPPYGRKALPLYAAVLENAGRLLTRSGHLLMIVPHYAWPELMSFPAPGLRFRWTLAMIQRAGPWPRLCNQKRNIAVTFKPIGWWTADPWEGCDYRQVEDSFENPAPDKSHFEWQQAFPWAEYCLQWCKEGGRVLDPFAGVGTVGVAAQACGIEFVGIELDEGRARIAANRCKP